MGDYNLRRDNRHGTAGIAPLLVGTAFNIILGGIVLALALAFGLGGKDAAARYLDELKGKRSEK